MLCVCVLGKVSDYTMIPMVYYEDLNEDKQEVYTFSKGAETLLKALKKSRLILSRHLPLHQQQGEPRRNRTRNWRICSQAERLLISVHHRFVGRHLPF